MTIPSFDSVEKAAEFLACTQIARRAAPDMRFKYAAGFNLDAVKAWMQEHPEYAGPILGALAGGGYGAATSLLKPEEDRNTLSSAITGAAGGGLLGLGGGLAYKNWPALGQTVRETVGGDAPKTEKPSLEGLIDDFVGQGKVKIDREMTPVEGVKVYPTMEAATAAVRDNMRLSGRELIANRDNMDPIEFQMAVRASQGVNNGGRSGGASAGGQPRPQGQPEKQPSSLGGWLQALFTADKPEYTANDLPTWEGQSLEDMNRLSAWDQDMWEKEYNSGKANYQNAALTTMPITGLLDIAQQRQAGKVRPGDFAAGIDALGEATNKRIAEQSANAEKLPGGKTPLHTSKANVAASRLSAATSHLKNPANAALLGKVLQEVQTGTIGTATKRLAVMSGIPASHAQEMAAFQRSLRHAYDTSKHYSGGYRPWHKRLLNPTLGSSGGLGGEATAPVKPNAPASAKPPKTRGAIQRGAIAEGAGRMGLHIAIPWLWGKATDQLNNIKWRGKPATLPTPAPTPAPPLPAAPSSMPSLNVF